MVVSCWRLSSSAAAVLTGPEPPDPGAIADVVMEFDADEGQLFPLSWLQLR